MHRLQFIYMADEKFVAQSDPKLHHFVRNVKYIFSQSEWVASAVEEGQKTPRNYPRQR